MRTAVSIFSTESGSCETKCVAYMRPASLIQRIAETGDVSNMVVTIHSPPASATNGAVLHVDGGVIPAVP
jgi:enoyl-[acyl-carrier-protein] reductase (NADH)